MERFSCNRLLSEYALSCIENYLLYLISERRTDWSLIFWESYLPFRQIIKLIEMGQDYSHFRGIKRLQSIAEQEGICRLKYLKSDSLPKEIIYNNVFAMQVKKEYIKNRYGKVLWRDDHYILFEYDDSTLFNYINDNPVDSGKMTIDNIVDIYANSIITFEIDELSLVDSCKTLEKCVQNMIKQNKQSSENNAETKDMSFEDLRDVIGIAKVLVKRMEAYIRVFDETYGLSEYYEYLSGWYVRIEYMRLKGKSEINIQDIINEINKRDILYGQIVLEKMRKIQEDVV